MDSCIKILVIEDEEHIRTVLNYNLKLDGFEVYLADNGIRGLDMAREKMPDLIEKFMEMKKKKEEEEKKTKQEK